MNEKIQIIMAFFWLISLLFLVYLYLTTKNKNDKLKDDLMCMKLNRDSLEKSFVSLSEQIKKQDKDEKNKKTEELLNSLNIGDTIIVRRLEHANYIGNYNEYFDAFKIYDISPSGEFIKTDDGWKKFSNITNIVEVIKKKGK